MVMHEKTIMCDPYICTHVFMSTVCLFQLTDGIPFMGSKILNFRNSNFKTCRMPTKMDNLKLK